MLLARDWIVGERYLGERLAQMIDPFQLSQIADTVGTEREGLQLWRQVKLQHV